MAKAHFLRMNRKIALVVAACREAFEMMAAGDPGVIDRFRDALKTNPDDPLARLHLGRLEKGATGATIVREEK